MTMNILAINPLPTYNLALSETRVLPIFSSTRHEPGLHSPNDSSRWPKVPLTQKPTPEASSVVSGQQIGGKSSSCTGTTNLSHTHPVLVAAQAAMLNRSLIVDIAGIERRAGLQEHNLAGFLGNALSANMTETPCGTMMNSPGPTT